MKMILIFCLLIQAVLHGKFALAYFDITEVQSVAAENQVCVVEGYKLKCWDSFGHRFAFRLSGDSQEPIQLSMGPYVFCAWTSQERRCWNSLILSSQEGNEIEFPELGEFKTISLGRGFACSLTEGEVR